MRLYSTREVRQIVLDALQEKGFYIANANHHGVEISQTCGRISQHFKVKVEVVDRDPL